MSKQAIVQAGRMDAAPRGLGRRAGGQRVFGWAWSGLILALLAFLVL